jgi:hypothetical protein
MNSDEDLLHQPDTKQKQSSISFKSRKQLGILTFVLIIVVVVGTGGYLLGMSNTHSVPLSQPSLLSQAKISATIAQPPSHQSISTLNKTSRLSTFPSAFPTHPLTVDRNLICTLADHDSGAVNWKTYTNTKYHYSFKYPPEANMFFNYKSNAPHNFNDTIYIKDPNDTKWNPDTGKWLLAFGLSITTSEGYRSEFNSYKDLLKKVYETTEGLCHVFKWLAHEPA